MSRMFLCLSAEQNLPNSVSGPVRCGFLLCARSPFHVSSYLICSGKDYSYNTSCLPLISAKSMKCAALGRLFLWIDDLKKKNYR